MGNDYQIPVDGYKGKYIEEIAEDVIKKLNINNLKEISSNYEKIKNLALEITLDSIKNDLEMLGNSLMVIKLVVLMQMVISFLNTLLKLKI